MDRLSILIVDDEPNQREILAGYLKKKQYDVRQAGSAAEALEQLKTSAIDIVLTDFRMPNVSGQELLQQIRSFNPDIAVVLMTAFGTIEGAVEAMRAGAYDYLAKPINLDELDLLLYRIAEHRHLLSENKILKQQLLERVSFEGIVSQSLAMERVLNTAARVAASKAPVLIRGESGTGKELIARMIHHQSPRNKGPFMAVNCAALNENLLESELFGHEKGAFTGADRLRHGRFEAADTGTLFLDEIGDLSPALQVKLLRVLQEQQFERVGGTQSIRVDVRVLTATNRNLEEMLSQGTFREDLYYRLNVVTIDIPPLRKRRDDIPLLLEHFLRRFAEEAKRNVLSFSKEAWAALLQYDYPGNIRELQNIVQRAVLLSRGEYITTEDLPRIVTASKHESELPTPSENFSLPAHIERIEKELIFEALRVHGGNQSKAARQLGISERNLRYRLKKWGVK